MSSNSTVIAAWSDRAQELIREGLLCRLSECGFAEAETSWWRYGDYPADAGSANRAVPSARLKGYACAWAVELRTLTRTSPEVSWPCGHGLLAVPPSGSPRRLVLIPKAALRQNCMPAAWWRYGDYPRFPHCQRKCLIFRVRKKSRTVVWNTFL